MVQSLTWSSRDRRDPSRLASSVFPWPLGPTEVRCKIANYESTLVERQTSKYKYEGIFVFSKHVMQKVLDE